MNNPETTPEDGQPEAKQPFKCELDGELRKRLFAYAKARGRSAAGAVRWLLHQQMTKEGF